MIPQKLYWPAAGLLISLTVIFPGVFFFSPKFNNYVASNIDRGDAIRQVKTSSALNILDSEKLDKTGRYDQYGIGRLRNASWYYGISGMDFYISLYNENIDVFHNHLGMLTSPWAYGYDGLNFRSELEALMGVEHYLIHDGQSIWLPYGYDVLEAEGQNGDELFQSYAPEINVSLMYEFTKKVDYEEYLAMNPFDRQQLLMQAVVTEGAGEGSDEVAIEDDELEYRISFADGVTINDNGYTADRNDGFIVIDLPEISDSELYVYFENINYSHNDDSSYHINVRALSNGEEIPDEWASYYGLNNKYHMYGGKTEWLINLGHTDSMINGLRITFQNEGDYLLDDIHIYTRSRESIMNSISRLVPLGEDMVIDDNRITATINADTDGIVMMSIPYSRGWKVYVDGTEVEAQRVDDAFIGFDITKGDHSLIMRYCTPGIWIGIFVTAVSLCIVVILRRKKL